MFCSTNGIIRKHCFILCIFVDDKKKKEEKNNGFHSIIIYIIIISTYSTLYFHSFYQQIGILYYYGVYITVY